MAGLPNHSLVLCKARFVPVFRNIVLSALRSVAAAFDGPIPLPAGAALIRGFGRDFNASFERNFHERYRRTREEDRC